MRLLVSLIVICFLLCKDKAFKNVFPDSIIDQSVHAD